MEGHHPAQHTDPGQTVWGLSLASAHETKGQVQTQQEGLQQTVTARHALCQSGQGGFSRAKPHGEVVQKQSSEHLSSLPAVVLADI